MTEIALSNHLILHVLGNILVEIRATDNIKKAKMLADVFHNAPDMISAGSRPEETYQYILQIARRLKCENTIKSHFDFAAAQTANKSQN